MRGGLFPDHGRAAVQPRLSGCGRGREFLSCSYPLSSPFALLDMDKAAARVKQALSRREHIAVFGDYDVDGITATCLLTEYLRSKGGHVTSYIPARLEEGYGAEPHRHRHAQKAGRGADRDGRLRHHGQSRGHAVPGAWHRSGHHRPPRVQIRAAAGHRARRPAPEGPAAAGHGNGGRRRCVQAGCRHRGRAGNASGSIL